MKEITYGTTLKTLEDVVAAEGENYVYPQREPSYRWDTTCYYVWEGKADCGAGRALHKLGVPLGMLAMFEGESLHGVFAHLERVGLMKFDAKSEALLRMFQYSQDQGSPWRVALAHAQDNVKQRY